MNNCTATYKHDINHRNIKELQTTTLNYLCNCNVLNLTKLYCAACIIHVHGVSENTHILFFAQLQ